MGLPPRFLDVYFVRAILFREHMCQLVLRPSRFQLIVIPILNMIGLRMGKSVSPEAANRVDHHIWRSIWLSLCDLIINVNFKPLKWR